MTARTIVAAVAAGALALSVACSGGGGAHVVPTQTFDDVHDELVERLDTIRVNIASVPDDIKARIKATCRNLEPFVGDDKTNDICNTLDEALDRADPGRIDRVLTELAELQP